MEKQNLAKQEEWSRMTEEEKFYAIAENKQKESRIVFPAPPAEGEGEETNAQNVQ